MLTKEYIFKKNPKYKLLSEIQTLNLWGNDIEDISILSECKNIEILSLSLNKISNISPLKNCLNLRELYLRKNNISSLNQIDNLINLQNLKILWLDENPISNLENYKDYIIKKLPQIIKLDNEIIDKTNYILKYKSTESCDSKKYKNKIIHLNEKKLILRRANSNETKKVNLFMSSRKRKNEVNCSLQENFSFLNFNNIVTNKSNNNLIDLIKQNKSDKKKNEFHKIQLKIIPHIKKKNKKITIKKNFSKQNIHLQMPISISNSKKKLISNNPSEKNILSFTINDNENEIKKNNIPNCKNKNLQNLLKHGIQIINQMEIKDLFILKERIEEKIENNKKNKN